MNRPMGISDCWVKDRLLLFELVERDISENECEIRTMILFMLFQNTDSQSANSVGEGDARSTRRSCACFIQTAFCG